MNKIVTAVKYLVLIIMSFFSIFPFYWMIVSATNTTADITKGKLTVGSYLVENVQNAFTQSNLSAALVNSTVLALSITVISLVISSVAGYAFVIYESKAKNILFGAIVASMMVPFAAKLIPMFRMFSDFKLVNSYASIILPAVATPFLIFFFRQNTQTFPVEIIQAARVDGLSEWGIFFRIYMPMMKSTYSAAGIIAFMASWNNYLWPMVMLQSNSKLTLPLAVANLAADFNPDYGMIMVGIIVSTIPMVLVFFLMQKSFVRGMVGSIK